ncbi:CHASE domain-containing sensor histidine kinase [Yeosuana marina]|uniref:CHASE domain-containing sensor histidine kinase n=1 Tax=Yeosuana marina TaxID=1565536 RepID=UPI0030C7D8BA
MKNISLKKISKNNWKSFAILVISILITITATIYTKKDLDSQRELELALVGNEIKAKIVTRLHSHAQLLRSGSAFFASSDTITRKKWKIFYDNSKINVDLPGIQGFGFSVIIKKEQLQQHILSIQKEGFPEYAVSPSGNRELYTSIIYLEPFEFRNQRAFGYDMYSEPIRRKAMEKARDYDIASLSGKVLLVQETNKDLQAGTLMYVPVYKNGMPTNTVEERRNAIIGWVYSPYRMFDLMQGILGRWDLNDDNKIHLQIYDNNNISQNSLLFDSQGKNKVVHSGISNQIDTIPIVFNEKKWTLLFSQSNGQFPYFQSKVLMVLLSGLAISSLLFFLSLSLFNTRFRAQKIAEKLTSKLKESEERWKFALEGARDGLWDWNLETNEVFFSTQWKEMLGFEEYEIKNSVEEWSKRVHPDDLEKCYSDIQLHLDGKTPFYSNTHRVSCKDGSYKWILDRGKIVKFNQNKKPIRIIGTHTDLTKQVELELQLVKLNSDKDRFITILAHDLKSPFNSILGFLDLLIQNFRNYNTNKIEEYLNIINNSAKNSFRLLEDILLWVRANSGKIPYQPQTLNFAMICNEAVEYLSLAASKKEITINQFPNNDITVFADKNMLNTIMRNLVSNAIKFSNKGGQIDIYTEIKDEIVTIIVSDNGVGINPDTSSKLFDITCKITTEGTENEKGTGLGLLLCKEFVEKHGGKIWVESKFGKGSSFKFTLLLGNDF